MTVKSYKDLIVWRKSIDLVKEIYLLTEQFSKEELYGLTQQIRRAVVSIPSCIAEGYLRRHRKEYSHFLTISLGSAAELETQIIICRMLPKFGHINFTRADSLLQEVLKMLYVMTNKIET